MYWPSPWASRITLSSLPMVVAVRQLRRQILDAAKFGMEKPLLPRQIAKFIVAHTY
jgi:hypothetical protein